ncbi:CPBP family intramembrane glutamic endopeptidase [Huintestinicola sp.]|uniref:CPBP family intramembrane glutamic endopeptidase n=1 Tax=Huintestinicola sp. TaxID=2981661 RepID=UPI003D7E3613
MEENRNDPLGQSHAPYPAYQPYTPGGGYYRSEAPVSENERRAIKRNYRTAFTEAIIHNIGSVVLANVIFVIMMLFGYEFRVNEDNTQIVDIPYAIAGSLPSILFCLGIFLYDKSSGRKKLSEYFRTEDITAGRVFAFFGMVMLFYSVSVILQQVVISGCFSAGFSPIKEEYLSEEELSVPYLVWDIIMTAILAPIGEELMFRGVILRRLSTVSQRFAIFASAAIFGLMHGNLLQMILGFCVGLVFGYAAVKTGSLLLPIAGHIFINFFAVSCSILTFLTDDETANTYWLCVLGVFFVIGIVTLVILLARHSIELPRSTEYHRKRTFPIMVSCVSFWVLLAVYIIDIVSKFGPVTEKLME